MNNYQNLTDDNRFRQVNGTESIQLQPEEPAHVWVQTGDDVAERRGISRDIEEGVNGDAEESVRFWHWWMAGERTFFTKDRPWERADVIVSGDAPAGVEPGEIAWIPGPLLPR